MEIDYKVAIIGAGFGGLIAALKLKNSGKNSFIIFERAGEIGGTWRDNNYPGCGCDVESNLYSISSEQNPNWSSTFSSQGEILQYLKDIINKNALQKNIRYNADIVDVKFIEEAGCWQLTDQNQNSVVVKMVILATGPFNRISIPALKGIETFEGKKFHSAEWDHTADLAGKKVAVIGTGASAIQIVPSIASQVADLYIFQRSAPWVLPKKNIKASSFRKLVFRYFPLTQKLPREFIYWLRELVGSSFIGNDLVHKIVTGIALKKLKKEVADAELRKKLT
ncbi:MAG: NAD(P)/FAD-dependent oxidoreductase, partial [Ginsengibacter sp.]